MKDCTSTVQGLPPWPTRKGRRGVTRDAVTRKESYFQIVDEIMFPQSGLPSKLICLQRLQFEEDDRIELRLGYYIIGKKPAMRGRWVWGQYATLLPADDFYRLIQEVHRREW